MFSITYRRSTPRIIKVVLATAYERDFRDFASLLLLEKIGPRALQSLAFIAEVVHGAPVLFPDPARFSFALGGKDRHPFPVPLKTYDESVTVLRKSLDSARMRNTEKLEGLRRLENFTRRIEERYDSRADFGSVVAYEFAISEKYGGRSVFDDMRKKKQPQKPMPAQRRFFE